MTREEKAVIIDELKQKFAENAVFYITDGGGMSVAQTNEFRRMCFQNGIEYKVVKNTLIAKALVDKPEDLEEFNNKVLKGTSGILFHTESGKAPAALLKKFYKASNISKPVFKGAYVDGGVFIGEDQLDALAKLKTKNEMIGEIIGMLQSPANNVISALQSGKNKLAGIVKALEDRNS